jgi:hypothetical protein
MGRRRSGEGGVGGLPSPDPYLLGRFFEAPNQNLVAGQEWPHGLRLSVVRGGKPPNPARESTTRSYRAAADQSTRENDQQDDHDDGRDEGSEETEDGESERAHQLAGGHDRIADSGRQR